MERWIKTTSLAAFTIALTLFAVSSTTRADDEPRSSPPAAIEPVLPPIDDHAQPTCSPPSQCFSNKGCDRICGKGLGTCVRINSCYSECACAAASLTE